MGERDFVEAIIDDPEDEMILLVFADWLEENGQADRAEWVRACHARMRLVPGDPGSMAVWDHMLEAWERCRPDCWNTVPLSGCYGFPDRGVMRLEASSKTAVARLGKVRWLPRAFEEGWLGWITIHLLKESVVESLMGWKEPVRQIPIHLELKGPITEEVLVRLLDIPRLVRLGVGRPALMTPSIHRLIDRQDLRSLTLQIGLNHLLYQGSRDLVTGLLDRVGQLHRLRTLTLEGPRPCPEDPAFLSRIVGMRGLKTLCLTMWGDLTIESLARLDGMASLERLNVGVFPGWPNLTIDRIREALPKLQVERAPW